MKYAVHHVTSYSYTQPVSFCHNQAHLIPRSHAWQRCLEFELTIHPRPTANHDWSDYFGNRVRFFSIEVPHSKLEVVARSTVNVDEPDFPAAKDSPAWEEVVRHLAYSDSDQAHAASQFVLDSPYIARSDQSTAYAQRSFLPNRPLIDAALDLTRRIAADFKYDTQATSVHTPTAEVFEQRRGVCQDFAHVQISCLRSLGLAARYVSGYLLTDPPPGKPRLVGADASHAWISIYSPGSGWIDIDPTNNQLAGSRHVTLAWGRDYGDVCPVKGVLIGGGQHTVKVSVDVKHVD
jgi:transglutaminase-like putative cysteine protease